MVFFRRLDKSVFIFALFILLYTIQSRGSKFDLTILKIATMTSSLNKPLDMTNSTSTTSPNADGVIIGSQTKMASAAAHLPNSSVCSDDQVWANKPFVDGGRTMIGGVIEEFPGLVEDVTSPILDSTTGQRIIIGSMAQMSATDAVRAVDAAKTAWDTGRGEWPQMSLKSRIEAIGRLVTSLKSRRDEIVNVLMWEICKTSADAAAEFDRTVLFIEATIAAIREADEKDGGYKLVSGIMAKVRRNAIGVMLILGPFNYPFNETYTALIPALLMGNVVVMKIPTVGGLAHVLTMEAYASALPPGVVNFVSGPGRTTMAPIMRSGVDVFSFIGGSKAANILLKEHPAPHRLKVWLSLEGKNLAIVADDADLDVAAEQCTIGSTTYNGQRCTAIKMMFVHESVADAFVVKLVQRVNALRAGLPWEAGVSITPLPEPQKPAYLQGLMSDAVSKGAAVVNEAEGGGSLTGLIMKPAVVYPVTRDMKLWHEEQFGPVVPVARYSDISEVHQYIADMPFGQQAAIFSAQSSTIAPLIDVLSTAVGRININTQCGRSPDVFPFSGRRSSALGTLSVTEAVNAFSIETVVAFKHSAANQALVEGTEPLSQFMTPL